MKKTKVQLSPAETTAYWWVNVLRKKVNEIWTKGTKDYDENEFACTFYRYSEDMWRNLYLQLAKHLEIEIEKVSQGNTYEIDSFTQDTSIDGHGVIDDVLGKITHCPYLDLWLSSKNELVSTIYSNEQGVSVWNGKSIEQLPRLYDASYILTGNFARFKFKCLMKAVMSLENHIIDFHSLSFFKESFCNEYKQHVAPEFDISELEAMFDAEMNEFAATGLVVIDSSRDIYLSEIGSIDDLGLAPLVSLFQNFMNAILEKRRSESGNALVLKKPENKN